MANSDYSDLSLSRKVFSYIRRLAIRWALLVFLVFDGLGALVDLSLDKFKIPGWVYIGAAIAGITWAGFRVHDEDQGKVHSFRARLTIPEPLEWTILKDEIKAEKRAEGSPRGGNDYICNVTYLQIPLRLRNRHHEKIIDVYDVEVHELSTHRELMPPSAEEYKIGGEMKRLYRVPGGLMSSLFNSYLTTQIPAQNRKDVSIIIKDAVVDNGDYDLSITFTDNYDHCYDIRLELNVAKYLQ